MTQPMVQTAGTPTSLCVVLRTAHRELPPYIFNRLLGALSEDCVPVLRHSPDAGTGLSFEVPHYRPPGLVAPPADLTPSVHVYADLRPDELEDLLLWALGAARAAGLPVTARGSALQDQIARGVPALAVRTPPSAARPAGRRVLQAPRDPQTPRWRLALYPPR